MNRICGGDVYLQAQRPAIAEWRPPLRLLSLLDGRLLPLPRDVQNQFDSTGNAELVVDAEEVVAHRVLRDAKPLSDSLVRQALRHQIGDLVFAYAEQLHSGRRGRAYRRRTP